MLKLKEKILAIFSKAKLEKSPEAEAELILFHSFRKEYPRIHTLSDLRTQELPCTQNIEEEALRIATERAKGLPLQHLTGTQFFYEHEYKVDDSTLIPRPETEILVREVIEWVKKTYGDKPFRFAELGIGSGIISIEILKQFKNARAYASEVSVMAIALARHNATQILGSFSELDDPLVIFEPPHEGYGFEVFLDQAPFDFIVSNPPYVSVNDPIEVEVALHEPHLALFPKVEGDYENPSYFYENFLKHSQALLKPKGVAFFEVPDQRAEAILHEFKNAGFASSRLIPDLTGRPRVLQASFTE